MVREWLAASAWLLALLGCGARTGLLGGAETDAAGSGAGGANVGSGGANVGSGGKVGTGGANVGAGGKVGGAGGMNAGGGGTSAGTAGMNVGGSPLAMRCEIEGDDARVADIKPDELATLDGAEFVIGEATQYRWTLQREDCDAVVQDAEFTLEGENERFVRFQPSRPAFYHFTLEATDAAGNTASCNLGVPVVGIGMRVELCWDTSTTTDLDLYLHTPFDGEPWFTPGSSSINVGLNDTTCNTSNATAELRGFPRVNWGYTDSALNACRTPSFDGFVGLGRCPNPRAADDNNQEIATGTTERMQLDNPRSGETFRVMVQNFSNQPARPHVFVYCGGERAAHLEAPSAPSDFVSPNPGTYGVMWRAADVTTSVDSSGKISCSAQPVQGNAVTNDDIVF